MPVPMSLHAVWCYTKPWGADTVQRDIFNMLSYDMWLLITMVSLTVLLCAVCCHNLRRVGYTNYFPS